MKIVKIAACVVACLICCDFGIAQHTLHPRSHFHAGTHADARALKHEQLIEEGIAAANFHAGIHSGSWTLKREQLLEEEKKDPYRSCPDPYCARCAKHLADYGHEYQYIGGPSQQQKWYRGTAGSIAATTQRGYDQHGKPYLYRGHPSAVMSWEYVQTLNHAIWEQVQARNAVAAEEAAQDRILLLTQLLADAKEQLRLTELAWLQIEPLGPLCCEVVPVVVVGKTHGLLCKKTYKQFCVEMKAGCFEVAQEGMCVYCFALARYLFDQEYVADVECELALAWQHWVDINALATEAVRIALLSKEDADKATRFKRLQFKPPKNREVHREVHATMGIVNSELPTENGMETEKETP